MGGKEWVFMSGVSGLCTGLPQETYSGDIVGGMLQLICGVLECNICHTHMYTNIPHTHTYTHTHTHTHAHTHTHTHVHTYIPNTPHMRTITIPVSQDIFAGRKFPESAKNGRNLLSQV